MRREDAGDVSGQDGPVEAGGVLGRGRLWRGLLLAFCCCHFAFLLRSIIPELPPRAKHGNPAMDLYRLAFGGRQQWTIFETIPVQHSQDVWLESEDKTRGEVTAGCVLPGFKPYPVPEKSRYYVLFYGLINYIDDLPYREAYLRKMAQLLAAGQGPGGGEKWSLVSAAGYTRNLVHSRRDGQVSVLVPKSFDLAMPGGNSR
jgi:hypothetical protein